MSSSRSTTLAAVAVALVGCSDQVTAIVVTVEARPAVRDIETLEVTLGNDNATISQSFTIDGRGFPLTFSVETPGRTGAVTMEARGLAEDGSLAALGVGEATIVPDVIADGTLLLDPADFAVNTDFAGQQRLAWFNVAAGTQIAAGDDGTFTIGFTDDCGALLRCDLWGRRFDVRSTPLATELEAGDSQFNMNFTEVFGNDPALAVNEDGVLMAAWTTGGEILAVTITPTGGPGAAVETTVSAGDLPGDPTVAALPDGRFVVVWAETDPDAADDVIRGRILDATGAPSINGETGDTGPFTIDTIEGNSPDSPAVAVRQGNTPEMAIVWRDGNVVKLRFTNSEGRLLPAASEITVINYLDINDAVWSPRVVATGDTRFVVGWAHSTFGGNVDQGELIVRKITPPTGEALGADSRLVLGLVDEFTRFGLAGSDTAAVLATWHACDAAGDGNGCGVVARVFRDTGLPVGDPFVVNTTVTGNQTTPSAAWLGRSHGGDGFAVTWTDDSRLDPDTSESGIRARVVYPAFDDARGVLGAACGGSGATPCGDGLVCMAGSDVARCHVACNPSGPMPHCPDGGVCTTAGESGAGCIF